MDLLDETASQGSRGSLGLEALGEVHDFLRALGSSQSSESESPTPPPASVVINNSLISVNAPAVVVNSVRSVSKEAVPAAVAADLPVSKGPHRSSTKSRASGAAPTESYASQYTAAAFYAS